MSIMSRETDVKQRKRMYNKARQIKHRNQMERAGRCRRGDQQTATAKRSRQSPGSHRDPEELVEWSGARLAACTYPRLVEIIDALPMTEATEAVTTVLACRRPPGAGSAGWRTPKTHRVNPASSTPRLGHRRPLVVPAVMSCRLPAPRPACGRCRGCRVAVLATSRVW